MKTKKWLWDDAAAVRIGTQKPDGTIAWRYGSSCYPLPNLIVRLSAPLSEGAPYHIRIEPRNGGAFNKLLDTFQLHCSDGKEFGVIASSLEEAKRKAPAAIKKALRYVIKKHQADYQALLKNLNV